MKKQLILFAFCIIAWVACSKKNNTTNNSTQAVTITPAPASQNSFNADLQFIASQTLLNSTGQFSWQFNNAGATFYNSRRIQVGSVLLNNVALQYNTSSQYYYTNTNNSSSPHWVVMGSQNIPSFSYTSKMPTCLNWNTFPDTIDHTKAFSLFIKYDVADQISPSIYRGGIIPYTNFGFFNTDTATFSFPAATYSVGNAQLLIKTSYTDKVFVNGVPMWFLSRITFTKNIYIK
ncbi:MAG TPA: hypothetical protein VF411_03875 [Bacteroidia bacterium]